LAFQFSFCILQVCSASPARKSVLVFISSSRLDAPTLHGLIVSRIIPITPLVQVGLAGRQIISGAHVTADTQLESVLRLAIFGLDSGILIHPFLLLLAVSQG
jgi:hypothetical protein